MARKRRSFTAEFKSKAVSLVLDKGLSVSRVARDLDLTVSALRCWVMQAKIDRGNNPDGALTTAEKEELARLRRENKVLLEEREILKKAAAFFAKENQ